jgi:hypothetical protein
MFGQVHQHLHHCTRTNFIHPCFMEL